MADPSHTQIPCEVELPKMPTLHQVLEAYRAVCEAVFASIPRPTLRHDSVQRLPDIDLTVASRGVQVYKFELDYSGTETGYRDHVLDISADIRKVHRALRKRNMCQEFCGLFDKLLRATLEEFKLGTSRWMQYRALPQTVFLAVPTRSYDFSIEAQLEDLREVHHDMLVITPSDDSGELFFDGTPEQFGLNESAWTGLRADLERDHSEGQESLTDAEEDIKRDAQTLKGDIRFPYLVETLDKVLQELDWVYLVRLDDNTLRENVYKQARDRLEIIATDNRMVW